MAPLGLSANALALALRVPATRVGAIIRDNLARYFPRRPRSLTSRPPTT